MHFPEDDHLIGRKMYVYNMIKDNLKRLYVFVALIIVSDQLNARSRII
jgi:hypothetical protein